MIDFYSAWSGFGAETKAALIGAFTTIAVGLIGFGGLICQIKSQGRQSREAVAENERRRIKATMYDDAVKICRELADTSGELSCSLLMMKLQIEFAAKAHAEGRPFDLPSARFPALLDTYRLFADAALKFVFFVENRRFINPKILIFRTAMSVVLHDTRKLMHSSFPDNVMTSLPVQQQDGALFPYTPPTVEHAARIKELCETFISSLNDAVMYTEDFLVELQNHLLGDLFGKVVQHRVPADPSKKVISLQHADTLEKWFNESTDWGREVAHLENEAMRKFAAQ